MKRNGIPHRRLNILTGEWVLVSPQRAQRPWQGKRDLTSLPVSESYDPKCYLCPGNTRASGVKNPVYTGTFDFENDFAALLTEGEGESLNEGLLRAEIETGICKVICFSPDHSLTLPLMDIETISRVVCMWRDEFTKLGALPEINNVQIFENKGAIMGCSNPHPHGQIWAQKTVPQEVMKKQHQQESYWVDNGKSLLLEYLNQELDIDERILYSNASFAVLIPYWAVWPYEAMIIPKRHLRDITEMDEKEIKDFSECIKHLTTLYDNLFETSFPYSSGIHQRPTDGEDHPEWHFHMSFYPPLLRSADIKKFMVGYELFANPQRDITAEEAAKRLKELPNTHYLLKEH